MKKEGLSKKDVAKILDVISYEIEAKALKLTESETVNDRALGLRQAGEIVRAVKRIVLE